ncbi:FtsX-like permease family protein [Algibacter amylolyticus]|uniref:ABC transporter permease n=1 Tax=Algibacter amylolyticus TaxID=1608400 RepID=A0A5M7BJU4_9FLAO|nr:ABC transporter permease [Algibacter amylolyticus]KAA5827804.1 ABC transporter permease [Algibacter amylolyticus]MBB5267032.1 putative ABC transport system permease protein [Algibacter amylolyticus]TSJ82049.1 FtsX-like permease family protein [Algibacter amylolyticus]
MFDLDLWREIFQSINMNRTRSLLSGFTVAFAILLFTILFGIANGLENTFKEAFGTDANNSIVIYPGKTTKGYKGLQAGRQIQFKNEDHEYVLDKFGDKVQYITSKVNRNVIASFKNEKNSYQLRAVHPEYMFIENNKISEGRYINQNDLKNKTKVAVIGRIVNDQLFTKESAIGKYVNLSGIPYKVVGVFTDDEGDNEERVIYIPITTAQLVYGNNDFIDFMHLTYNPEMNSDQALSFGTLITKSLKERFSVARSDQRAIRVRNMAQSTKQVDMLTSGLTVIILVIGFGTLIAGIVGISNIMIFIVKERTKEIGIRKALGASPKSIIAIILIESIIITTIAGYVGLLIGVGVLEWIGPSLEKYFITSPGVSNSLVIGATITLILAGAIAGYLPAKKASEIKPIVALRND